MLHFSAQAQIIKIIHPGKIFYTSGNKKPEKTSYNFSKESFSYILEKGSPEKNYLCFRKTKPKTIFLYFRKRNFLIFQETDLSYISGKVYSEP